MIILEGILALHDQRVLDLLDMKIFVEADGDLCLSRRSELCLNLRETVTDVEASKSSVMYAKEVVQSRESSSNGSSLSSPSSINMLNRNDM